MSPRTVVALDVETADTQHARICSIALVRIEDGKIVAEWSSLVCPLEAPAPRNTEVHGLTWADLHDAPPFADVWRIVLGLLDGAEAIVAHWAKFDRESLAKNCALEGLPAIELPWICTVELARQAWPQLPNHKLPTVSAHLGIELKHHDAMSDALACARIYLATQPKAAPAPAPAAPVTSEERMGTDGPHRWAWATQAGSSALSLDGKLLLEVNHHERSTVLKVHGQTGLVFHATLAESGNLRVDEITLEALRFAVLAARARKIQLSNAAWKKIVDGRPQTLRRAA